MVPISGLADPEGAQVIRRVLHGVADELYRRDHHDHPADDPVPFPERSNEQRLADGTPLPASVARRMACAAGFIPAVLGGASRVLDLGRTQRFASPAQRLALELMWGTCSFADCRTPAATLFTDAA